LKKIMQQRTHARPKWDEPTLVEFTFSDNEQLAVEIDITYQQAHHFTHAHTESVEDGKDSTVGHCSQRQTRVVWQGTGYFEQTTRYDGIEDEREQLCRSAFGSGLYRNTREKSMQDEPLEQSTDRSEEMIVTSRSLTWTRKQERIHQFRADLLNAPNLFLNQISVQDVQDILLGPKTAADRTLVSQIFLHPFTQDALETCDCAHCKTSSPSPQATSRRGSMATFV
jgi:hypothetical protein